MPPTEPAEWEALVDKAEFCIGTGIAPSEYDAMDDLTREAFVSVFNRINAKR